MKKECFKEVVSPLTINRIADELKALAKIKATKTATVFQGWKRYAEAEEEE